MKVYFYRWEVAEDEREAFEDDWTDLTRHIQEQGQVYGLISAKLYETDTGFIAIAEWNSEDGW